MRRTSLAFAAALALASCGKESPHEAPPAASSPAPVAASAAPPVASSAAPAPLPPAPAIVPACCMIDKTEGHFGAPKGVQTRYEGEFLRRKDGERLLYPQDLISDTK